MALTHLLSIPLYEELFHHNVVSSDGRVIANDEQLKKYNTFLVQQSRDGTAKTLKERKDLVDKCLKLISNNERSAIENERLESYIKELGFYFKEDGTVSYKEIKQPPKRYVGPPFPEMSAHERQIELHKICSKIEKRDLKELDGWLSRISESKAKMPTKSRKEWMEAEKRYRNRTQNRLNGMARNRHKIVEKMDDEYIRQKWTCVFDRVVETMKISTMMIQSAGEREEEPLATEVSSDVSADKKKEVILQKFRNLVKSIKGTLDEDTDEEEETKSLGESDEAIDKAVSSTMEHVLDIVDTLEYIQSTVKEKLEEEVKTKEEPKPSPKKKRRNWMNWMRKKK